LEGRSDGVREVLVLQVRDNVCALVFLRVGPCGCVRAEVGIWYLDVELRLSVVVLSCVCVKRRGTYCKVACPPQRDDLDGLLLANVSVPVVDPPLESDQLPLHARQAHVVPQPKGSDAHDGVETGAEGEGVEGIKERVIDLLDQCAEVGRGSQRWVPSRRPSSSPSLCG
jgi:hypothetical protein